MEPQRYYDFNNGLYCVHFPNRCGLSIEEIKTIFSEFGEVAIVSKAGDDYGHRFVKYRKEDEVIRCVEGLRNNQSIRLKFRDSNFQKNRNQTNSNNNNNNSNTVAGSFYGRKNYAHIAQRSDFNENKNGWNADKTNDNNRQYGSNNNGTTNQAEYKNYSPGERRINEARRGAKNTYDHESVTGSSRALKAQEVQEIYSDPSKIATVLQTTAAAAADDKRIEDNVDNSSIPSYGIFSDAKNPGGADFCHRAQNSGAVESSNESKDASKEAEYRNYSPGERRINETRRGAQNTYDESVVGSLRALKAQEVQEIYSDPSKSATPAPAPADDKRIEDNVNNSSIPSHGISSGAKNPGGADFRHRAQNSGAVESSNESKDASKEAEYRNYSPGEQRINEARRGAKDTYNHESVIGSLRAPKALEIQEAHSDPSKIATPLQRPAAAPADDKRIEDNVNNFSIPSYGISSGAKNPAGADFCHRAQNFGAVVSSNESKVPASCVKSADAAGDIPALSMTKIYHKKSPKEGGTKSLYSTGVNTPKIETAEEVIVANIHKNFGVNYILHLFEKHNPLSISEMKIIPSLELRFCVVYFQSMHQAYAIEKEFDEFDLSGKNLIVLRRETLAELSA